MLDLIREAGLTPDILIDPEKRAYAINEFNAAAGKLRELRRGEKIQTAPTIDIPVAVSDEEAVRYLRFSVSGKRIPIIFAAGRATRMKLPAYFDKLGIAGLTPRILSEINALRQGEDVPLPVLSENESLKKLVSSTSHGEGRGPLDMSFIHRQLLQYRHQTEQLLAKYPSAKVKLMDWLFNATFAVVVNEENKHSIALQLASVGFMGLKPERVYLIVQPEEGGLEIAQDGSLKPYDADRWPEGHGKPFIDMQTSKSAAFRLNSMGHLVPLRSTFVEELQRQGVERAVFAQVNDLHLLSDMLHVERWLVADYLIGQGAEMVMEMVENALKQKGGGIFKGPNGATVMRDTIAMKSKDLEEYSVPKSLSRMFYELTVTGMSKLTAETLPAYLNERKTASGKTVLTKEYYSGDASSVLNARAIQQNGVEIHTFKMQSRIPTALEELKRQDAQPGYFSLFKLPQTRS